MANSLITSDIAQFWGIVSNGYKSMKVRIFMPPEQKVVSSNLGVGQDEEQYGTTSTAGATHPSKNAWPDDNESVVLLPWKLPLARTTSALWQDEA